jgi:hypothetical protein
MASVLDLAAHSGLPVETVLRVLLRKPANEAAKRKVAEAVDVFGLPDYPRPDNHIEVLPAQTSPALPEPATPERQDLALELRNLFQELVARTDRERRERIDDLELSTDLITETWCNVDRRLGRLEKMVERVDRHEFTQRTTSAGAEVHLIDDVRRTSP